ncbi:MAG: hypothetical protein GEU99_04375 [Luteitalea sp.]|nr:hypothetical protein [Luteitalea sp.]
MNTIFAVRGSAERFNRMCRAASEVVGVAPAAIEVRSSSGGPALCLGVTSDGGWVAGRATLAGSSIVALGSTLQRADHPDRAAARLLERFLATDGALPRELDVDVIALIGGADGTLVLVSGAGPHRVVVHDSGEEAVVASHLWLVAAGVDRAAFDRAYEDFLLCHAFVPHGRTILEGVTVLPPRGGLSLPSNRRLEFPRRDVESASDARTMDRRAVAQELLRLVTEAVARQAQGCQEQGVLLGGVDSALVAAILHRLGYSVRTFTYLFGEERYNQRHVDDVVKAANAKHTWVSIEPDRIASTLRRFGECYNQPVAQPHYILHALAASEAARDLGVRHIFSGDGADAVLLGYPTVNQRARLLSRVGILPPVALRTARSVLGLKPVERVLGHGGRRARGVLEQAMSSPAARGHLPVPIFDEIARRRLRAEQPPQHEDVAQIREQLAPRSALHPMRLALQGHAAIGQSRSKVEGTVAATGVAQSSPYHDQSVQQFGMSIPETLLRPPSSGSGDVGKRLFLDAIVDAGLLPASVVYQAKQSPVASPIDRWYRTILRPTVEELVGSLPFTCDARYMDELFGDSAIDRAFRNHIGRLGDHILQPIGLLASYGALAHACRRAASQP